MEALSIIGAITCGIVALFVVCGVIDWFVTRASDESVRDAIRLSGVESYNRLGPYMCRNANKNYFWVCDDVFYGSYHRGQYMDLLNLDGENK